MSQDIVAADLENSSELNILDTLKSLYNVEQLGDYRFSILLDLNENEGFYLDENFKQRLNFWNNFLGIQVNITIKEDENFGGYKKLTIDVKGGTEDKRIKDYMLSNVLPYIESRGFKIIVIAPDALRGTSIEYMDKYSDLINGSGYETKKGENPIKDMILYLESIVCNGVIKQDGFDRIKKSIESGTGGMDDILVLMSYMTHLSSTQLEVLRDMYKKMKRYKDPSSQGMLMLVDNIVERNSPKQALHRRIASSLFSALTFGGNSKPQKTDVVKVEIPDVEDKGSNGSGIVEKFFSWYERNESFFTSRFANDSYSRYIGGWTQFDHDGFLYGEIDIRPFLEGIDVLSIVLNNGFTEDKISSKFERLDMLGFFAIFEGVYDKIRSFSEKSVVSEEQRLQAIVDNIETIKSNSYKLGLLKNYLLGDNKFLDRKYLNILLALKDVDSDFTRMNCAQVVYNLDDIDGLRSFSSNSKIPAKDLLEFLHSKVRKQFETGLKSLFDFSDKGDFENKLSLFRDKFGFLYDDIDSSLLQPIRNYLNGYTSDIHIVVSGNLLGISKKLVSILNESVFQRSEKFCKFLLDISGENSFVERWNRINEFIEKFFLGNDEIRYGFFIPIQRYLTSLDSKLDFKGFDFNRYGVFPDIISISNLINSNKTVQRQKLNYMIDSSISFYARSNVLIGDDGLVSGNIEFNMKGLFDRYANSYLKEGYLSALNLFLSQSDLSEKVIFEFRDLTFSGFRDYIDEFNKSIQGKISEVDENILIERLTASIDDIKSSPSKIEILKGLITKNKRYFDERYNQVIKALAIVDKDFKRLYHLNTIFGIDNYISLVKVLKRLNMSLGEVWESVNESVKKEIDADIRSLFEISIDGKVKKEFDVALLNKLAQLLSLDLGVENDLVARIKAFINGYNETVVIDFDTKNPFLREIKNLIDALVEKRIKTLRNSLRALVFPKDRTKILEYASAFSDNFFSNHSKDIVEGYVTPIQELIVDGESDLITEFNGFDFDKYRLIRKLHDEIVEEIQRQIASRRKNAEKKLGLGMRINLSKQLTEGDVGFLTEVFSDRKGKGRLAPDTFLLKDEYKILDNKINLEILKIKY